MLILVFAITSREPARAESFQERVDRLLIAGPPQELLKQRRQDYRQLVQKNGLVDEATLDAAGLLGTLELWLGHPRDAESALRPVVQTLPGKDQPATLVSAHLFNEMGVACYQLARFAEAKQWLERAYSIRKDRLGEEHVDTLQSLRNLAAVEEGLGHWKESQELYRQCSERLKIVVEESQIPEPSSSEAVILLEGRPEFPRIVLDLSAAAPVMPPEKPAPVKRSDIKGWVSAHERLNFVLRKLNIEDSSRAGTLAEHARSAFGERHLKTFLIVANTRPGFRGRQELVPKPFGPDHPVLATVLVARALNEMSSYDWLSRFESDPFVDLEAAERIRRTTLGEGHPLIADIQEIRGVFLQQHDQLEPATAEFEKSLAIRERQLSPGHFQIGTSLAALGVVHYERGELALSRQSLNKALEIYRHHLGNNAGATAAISGDLAAVARTQGDYVFARQVLEEAVQVLIETQGLDSRETQIAMSNLAVVQAELGDLENAARHFQRMLESDKLPSIMKSKALLNLAVIERLRGAPREAMQRLNSILADDVNNLQAKHQLGAAYRDLGELRLAEAILAGALLSQSDPLEKAQILQSIGLLNLESGNAAVAVSCFQECLKTYRAQLGSTSRYTAEALRQLGTSYLLSQDFRQARECLEEAIQIKSRWAQDQLPYLAEADAVHFATSLGELDPLLSVSRLDSSMSVAEAYQAVWTVKSAATRAIVARRASRSDSLEQEPVVEELRTIRQKLATLIQSREIRNIKWSPLRDDSTPAVPGRRSTSWQQYEDQVRNLTLKKEHLERLLAQNSPAFHRHQEEISGTPEELRRRLPANVAVVDIVKAKAWRQVSTRRMKTEPETIYEAFVLRSAATEPDSGIVRVELGPAEQIDQEISRWRDQFSASNHALRGITKETASQDEQAGTAAALALRQLIWEKLSDALTGVEICLVIPDGKIAQLPLGALPGDQPETYLAEQITFVTTSFGQHVLMLLEDSPITQGEALLVGGVSFEAASPTVVASAESVSRSRGYRIPSGSATRGSWGALPGTRQEILQIKPLWNGTAHILSGEEATKSALIQALRTSRFVHLATHGFFSNEPVDSMLAIRGQISTLNGLPLRRGNQELPDLMPLAETLVARNPLVLSGVVLAGANSNAGEGLLTAEELVDLDLSGVELVTLSACETGLGATAGGEGVFGLQRAFTLAGARSSLASLWKVDDAATTILMTEFYRNLWEKKMSRAESLRAAQVRMLRGELDLPGWKDRSRRVPPYYWAPFILSGDWR